MSILRPLFAVALCSSLGLVASACSSKDIALPSGGVAVTLTTPDAVGTAAPEHCPDSGLAFSLVDVQSDNQPHLLTDGAAGASVKCSVGDTSFTASVNRKGLSFSASGHVHADGTGFTSTDTQVTILTSTNNYQSSASAPCSVTFDVFGGGAAHASSFACPGLSGESNGTCAIRADDGTHLSVFSFTNCN